MKFIPLLFVLGLISANSQITTTTGAKVYVSPGTLVYSTGDFTVKKGTTQVTNKGNIRIGKIGDPTSGTYVADADAKPDAFLLTYDGRTTYGQMIIQSGKKASGKVSKQYNLNNSGGVNVYLGIPFAEGTYNKNNLISDLTKGAVTTFAVDPTCWPGACPAGTYNSFPILRWEDSKQVFHPDQWAYLQPGSFYLLRRNSASYSSVNFNEVTLTGTPYVGGTSAPIPFSRTAIKMGYSARNEYTVRYYTYVSDPFAKLDFTVVTTNEQLNTTQYAQNTLQLMNPFTSNLDLATLTSGFTNVKGIASYDGVTTPGGFNTRYEGQVRMSTADGGGTVGDNMSIIPPMTNFILKGDDGVTGLSVNFTPDAQTFTIGDYYDVPIEPADATARTGVAKAKMAIAPQSTTNGSGRYQLNLRLWDKNKDKFISNTYLYSSDTQTTGVYNDTESRNTNLGSSVTGVYTIPEATTGGVDPNNPDIKLYINTINTDAAKVAIPLGINLAADETETSFTFTANLKENGVDIAKNNQTQFSNPSAKFYLHDKKSGSVTEIDETFSFPVKVENDDYTKTNADGSKTVTRYEIFWKEAGTMGNEDIQTLDGLTSVYKTGSDYKVRFDKNWSKADVTIFNVLGQLISSEKNINTQDDYLLPINGSSSTMYIIKITNDKGEAVTKKIVK